MLGEQVRTRRDGLVSQTTWLLNLGQDGPRFAMLLDFFPASAGRRGAAFTPGEQFRGELVFYPARSPLRAVLVRRDGTDADRASIDWPATTAPLEEALSAPLLAEPWATERPILLPQGRIGFDRSGAPWWRPRDGAVALPVAGETVGLIAGTELTAAAVLWSGSRMEMLAAQTPWGRVGRV